MKRKHSQEHLHCATDGESGRRAIRDQEPDQIIDLEKQYDELCRLRDKCGKRSYSAIRRYMVEIRSNKLKAKGK